MRKGHFAGCKSAPTPTKKINGFDCDGVLTIGIRPAEDDVILTGRSFEEIEETKWFLSSLGLKNQVFYNPVKFEDKTRTTSGIHKGLTIWDLFCTGVEIAVFFEDDPLQIKEIKKLLKRFSLKTNVVWVNHGGIVELENVRHQGDPYV